MPDISRGSQEWNEMATKMTIVLYNDIRTEIARLNVLMQPVITREKITPTERRNCDCFWGLWQRKSPRWRRPTIQIQNWTTFLFLPHCR